MKILFYIEPAIFCHNGMTLAPHCNFVRALINANWREDVVWCLAASPWLTAEYNDLVETHGGQKVQTFDVNPAQLLQAAEFDVIRYSLDLFRQDFDNEALIRTLNRLKADCAPDVVICSTQNSYIRHVFHDSTVIWHDLSHILRKDSTYNLYLDTCGHQVDAILNARKADILALPMSDVLANSILERHDAEVFRNPEAVQRRQVFRDWKVAKGLSDIKLALIALQQSQLINVEGAYEGKPADVVLMSAVNALPAGWKAVVSYHPADQSIAQLEPFVAQCFDRLVQLPPEIARLRSDALVPEYDAIITVSSKVGLMGLLAGKPVVSLGESAYYLYCCRKISELNKAIGMNKKDIARLIQFMSNRYYFTFDELFLKNHYILNQLHTMRRYSSPQAYQLDVSDWTIDNLNRLF